MVVRGFKIVKKSFYDMGANDSGRYKTELTRPRRVGDHVEW